MDYSYQGQVITSLCAVWHDCYDYTTSTVTNDGALMEERVCR
jgi:hypothetical protein